ncbi:MAG: hypothetical protein V1818_01870 [Candidatus Aenigmatarchaeota archaeon]
MKDGKKMSYNDVLGAYVGKKVTFRFMAMNLQNTHSMEKIEGRLSKGPVYYTVHGERAVMMLVPGASGEIEAGGQKYDLRDLV